MPKARGSWPFKPEGKGKHQPSLELEGSGVAGLGRIFIASLGQEGLGELKEFPLFALSIPPSNAILGSLTQALCQWPQSPGAKSQQLPSNPGAARPWFSKALQLLNLQTGAEWDSFSKHLKI